MKFDKQYKDSDTIKSELNIRQEKPSKLIMVDNIEPYNNHIIFEIDQFKRTINVAQFTSKKILHWFEILDNSYRSHEILKKTNCNYISSMNVSNLIKKVSNKFSIDISGYTYIPEKGIVGSLLNVKVMETIKP